jgi:hypothetical protein
MQSNHRNTNKEGTNEMTAFNTGTIAMSAVNTARKHVIGLNKAVGLPFVCLFECFCISLVPFLKIPQIQRMNVMAFCWKNRPAIS